MNKGRHKKTGFHWKNAEKGGGGGLVQVEITLAEKTEIFLQFFLFFSKKRGGLMEGEYELVMAEDEGFSQTHIEH